MTKLTAPSDPEPITAVTLRSMEAVRPTRRLRTPTPPLARAQKTALMGAQLVARGLANEAATAALLPWRMDEQTWHELAALQQAVLGRLAQQQKDWMTGWATLAQEQQQMQQANTLSKVVEQEYDLLAQTGALMASQCAAFVGLLENLQVDYAYWMSQKTQR